MLGIFYEGATKRFNVTITLDGVPPNISEDAVTFYLKEDVDGDIVLTKEGEVVSSGANGVAKFHLTPEDLNIPSGSYFAFVEWSSGTDKEIVLSEMIKVYDGVGV